jgi:hypothetical protein
MTINYKVFTAGDTLSANDVLTYLENQAVIKVDAASELPTLATTYPNVKVAYAADTDKVYVNDDGTFVALVTADGTVTLSNLTLTGDLTVQGTTTTIDSTTIAIKDKFVFEGATADAHETSLVVEEPTADRTVTIPNATTTLVGRDTTDTLTNKTINLSSNTVSATLAQLNTAISDADVASLAGSETLTNKTISGSSNTLSNIGNASLTNSSITMDGSPVSLGGTFTSPASYALPSQTGNSGKFLTTNGTAESWGTVDLTTKTDKSTLTTTGDIYYASSANTPARLGIGSASQVLTVSGGVPTWAAPAGGGANWSLLNSGGTALSGAATVTVSGISGKDKIMILIEAAKGTGAQNAVFVRLNTDTGNNYYIAGSLYESASSYAAANLGVLYGLDTASRIAPHSTNANSEVAGYYLVTGCNAAGVKVFNSVGSATAASGSSNAQMILGGYYNSSSTISSISIFNNTGNFTAGKVYVYTSA